jgi:sugar lactone lactonase YvrE
MTAGVIRRAGLAMLAMAIAPFPLSANAQASADPVAPYLSLATPNIIVEGMARDPVSNDLLFASVYRPAIVRRRADGNETLTPIDPSFRVANLLGMKVDSARSTVWVCASLHVGQRYRHVLLALSLKTLKVRRSIPFRDDDQEFLCNDVDVLPDGRAVSTAAGTVWVVNGDRMAPIAPVGVLNSPNGLAVDGDDHVYVATVDGIVRVRVSDGHVETLRLADGNDAAGIDGLYRRHNYLIGIQNGVVPIRIVRIALGRGRMVGSLDVLASSSPHFVRPTTGALIGDDFVFLTNPQLSKVRRGVLVDGVRVDPIRILKVRAF